jgi:DNA-binding response OmpR family regulator
MTSRTILIVDDDADLRETLVEQLSLYEEFEVLEEATAGKGVQTARGGIIDLLIMDVGLPDMDGREAVKLLRKGGFKAPIIMLTGHDTDSDTILGLEAGANDYVTKPFRFAVLLARIRAQLRQHEQSEDATFSVGPYVVQAKPEAAARPARRQGPADRKGSLDHQISLPRRPESRDPRRAAGRSLGI